MNLTFNPGPTIGRLAAAATINFGERVVADSSGTLAVAGIGVRGCGIAQQGAATGERVAFATFGGGWSEMVGISSEAIAVGDPVYSAASGRISKTSGGGAVLLGTATSLTSGAALQFTFIPHG